MCSRQQREIIWVVRLSVFGVGAIATVMALQIQSIYALWYLCSDLIYAVLFPQLCCVIYVKDVNTYGALIGYVIALILRIGGGEVTIGLDPFIKYPFYSNKKKEQLFPFRTLAMLCSFFAIVFVSYFVKFLFNSAYLSRSMMFFAVSPVNTNKKRGRSLIEITRKM